jgi:hypothetical protein
MDGYSAQRLILNLSERILQLSTIFQANSKNFLRLPTSGLLREAYFSGYKRGKNMKYLKLIIITAIINSSFIGCSYVSDMVEGAITKRASFSVKAEYIASSNEVRLTWDKTDSSGNFAGIEVYRTSQANDEYADYELVASRETASSLGNGNTTSYSETNPPSGIFFYRIGFIHWDESLEKRTQENGYNPPYDPNNPTDTSWDSKSNYDRNTDIDAISGYGNVNIP